MIGANCYLITVNHRTDHQDIPYAQQGFQGADVRLGQNVWLGSLVVVLPGVTIGDNVIVGAGAVVTRDIPEGETWAGVPARKIKK
ncbi:MAG: acyltransferase [Verrucomicrobiae bacterium]|nr:acyltransferase [Verrucomicrobiae bacterium]NNJ44020.1 acyltransferase [Akkermansiaceae bacterium]